MDDLFNWCWIIFGLSVGLYYIYSEVKDSEIFYSKQKKVLDEEKL